MMFLAYAIPIVLILLCLLRPKSKLIGAITILYICLIIAFNTKSPDRDQYVFMYDYINTDIFMYFEPASVWLMKICSYLGMSFFSYRFVVSMIVGVLLYIGIRRLTDMCAIGAAIAMLYPCIAYASGIRSAIAFSISVIAFSYLFQDKKGHYIKYIICVLIATLFHYSAIGNIIFVLSKWKINNKRYIALLAADAAVIYAMTSGLLYAVLSKIIKSEKVLEWFLPTLHELPSPLAFLFFAGVDLLVFYIILVKKKNVRTLIIQERFLSVVKIATFLVPLLGLSLNYERMIAFAFFAILCEFTCMRDVGENSQRVSFLSTGAVSLRNIMAIGFGLVFNIAYYFIVHGNLYFPMFVNNLMFGN